MRIGILLSLIFYTLFAKPIVIDVNSIIQDSYKDSVVIEKDKIMLSKEELQKVKKIAKLPVKSKLYRYYKVKQNDKIVGYGILISKRVRTKKATVLYFIENDKVKFIEILAFFEPHEFIPKDVWLKQFKDKNIQEPFKIGKDFPTISGATLSARTITGSARLAIALYKVKLK